MVPKQQVHKNIHMQHGLQGFMKSSKLSHFMGILLFGAIVLSGCNKHHTKAMTSESNGLGRGTPSRSKSSGGLSCIFCCSTSVLDAVNDTSGKFPTTTSNSPEVNAGGVFQTVNLSAVEGGGEVEAIAKPVQEQRNTESEEISAIQEAQESTPIDDPRGDSSKIPSAPGDEEQQSAAAENTDVDAPNLSSSSELEEENLNNNNGVTYPAETTAASVVESDRSQHARQGSEDRSTKSLANISGLDVPPPLNRTIQDRNDENESLNSSIASYCSIGPILPEGVQNDWNRPIMSSQSVSAIPEQQHAPKDINKSSTRSLPDISRPYVFTLSKRTSRNRNDENESVYSSIASSCSIGSRLPEEVQNDWNRPTISSQSVSAILEQQHAPKGSGGRNRRSTQSLPDISRPCVSTLSKRTSRNRNDENESVNSSIVTATDLTTDQGGVIMVEEHGDITKTLYAVEVGSLLRDSKKIPESVQSAPIGKNHKTIIKGNSSRKSAPGVHGNAAANTLGVLVKRFREEVAKKEEQSEDLLFHIEIESVVNGSNEGEVTRFAADSSNSQEEENNTTNTVGDHKENTEAEETGHREQKEE
jgi:hypothetical protein